MSVIIDIADKIVSNLNNEKFNMDFTAARKHLPRYKLEDMDILRVTVVPKAEEIPPDGGTRNGNEFNYQIDVAVQRKFGPDETMEADEFDDLMDLREEIIDFLRGANLATTPAAHWISIKNEPIYDPKQISEMRLFTSLITLTYWICREKP